MVAKKGLDYKTMGTGTNVLCLVVVVVDVDDDILPSPFFRTSPLTGPSSVQNVNEMKNLKLNIVIISTATTCVLQPFEKTPIKILHF